MQKVADILTMQKSERAAIESGTDEQQLTLRAANCIVDYIQTGLNIQNIAIICGSGGNGRDGIVCADILNKKGYNAQIYTINNLPKIISADLIIDALFGIGLNRNIDGLYKQAVELINNSGTFILSCDIPSGINGDNGKIMGCAVKADVTICFGAIKLGVLKARDNCGKILCGDIGISITSEMNLIQGDDFILPKRKSDTHKGDYGRVRIIGGNPQMPGAPMLSYFAGQAALKSGAGLCAICVPKSLAAAYQSRVLDNTLILLDDEDGFIKFCPVQLQSVMQGADSIVIGMGMSTQNKDLKIIIEYLAFNFEGVLILDADALNVIAHDLDCLKGHKAKLILTPHIGEFLRFNLSILKNPAADDMYIKAKALAAYLDCVIVLKSNTTLITDGQSVYFNIEGTAAMAKGGSGDVLAGIIAAYSKRLEILQAACRACFVHGRAGILAEQKYGENSVLASDLINFICG